MTGNDIRQKYIQFFVDKGHAHIPAAPLVPENDPTTLFTSSGMQPLVPYLKGEPHSMGNRLVDSQPSFRAEDIEEVGDNRHTTFFEMLGNWSLGDYFKKEQLPWFFEFLTKVVGLNPNNLYATVFEGNNIVPRDEESIAIWQQLFNTDIPAKSGSEGFDPSVKIYMYSAKKNWWSRAGTPDNMPPGEIGGPDSEVFYDFGADRHLHENSPFKDEPCHVNCDCGRFMEIGNSVFMQYIKKDDGSFEPLPKQNVDFGGGLERIAAAANDDPNVFNTDFFSSTKKMLEEVVLANHKDSDQSIRIILDHLRASIFLVDAGVIPSSKLQGYILRRLIRRSALHAKLLNIDLIPMLTLLIKSFISNYGQNYDSLTKNQKIIITTISEEIEKFDKTLNLGMKKILKDGSSKIITGSQAFDYYQTYGFPKELIQELASKNNLEINLTGFEEEKNKHAEKSRTASAGLFKGGLADQSEAVTKYHTATHLLHKALRDVLGDHVQQMGSNITAERLRFDFKHPEKLTPEELEKVEALVNQKIEENLPVHKTIEDKGEALQKGALAFFREKYPEKVSVYTIGRDPIGDWFSKELCGGPHVSSTGEIGAVTIKKEESIGAGTRRIYMVFRQ